MNALNIISSRVIGQPSSTSDDSSSDHILATSTQSSDSSIEATQEEEVSEDKDFRIGGAEATSIPPYLNEDEKVSSLEQWPQYDESAGKGWRFVPRVLVDFTLSTFKWIFSTVAYPAIYLVSCVYDDRGNFSLMLPLRRLRRMFSGGQDRPAAAQAVHTSPGAESHTVAAAQSRASRERRPTSLQRTPTANSSSSSAPSSDSETEIDHSTSAVNNSSPSRHTRSKSQSSISSDDDAAPSRRSIRIRLNNGDGSKAGTSGKFSSASGHVERPTSSSSNSPPAISPATLKSPTSPASSLKLTRYPRFPAPPRPLIPKRQPSYAIPDPSISRLVQKTLIIDLDETLIHSLARGGRMSTGHMVEVKLNVTVGVDGTTIGPQHPILYYVHKRPHCDEFLRKVCKWYNLVVFTASVQEYADPVIDWLEQERKYFSGRYYRQHCTFRNGAYIKDVSSVEPDLSKVMILDNSPMSYIFHEDNAIPIEGWINDPTDNDLLHLIPLLEALQYVTDVRALLALRMGEVPPP